jgi:hypothetical protein
MPKIFLQTAQMNVSQREIYPILTPVEMFRGGFGQIGLMILLDRLIFLSREVTKMGNKWF